jgi:calcineurin-like phosphoesterase family protein
MNYFTSDEHYNHANILKLFVYRPFKSTEEMNSELRKRHNERVKDNDTVFHLGDFKVSSAGENVHDLIKQLNGNHVFIKGNHDKNNGVNTCIKYMVIQSFGKNIVLTHRPEDAEFMLTYRDIDLALVGHVHDKWKFKDRIVNVGVDQWNFYPVHLKQILKEYERWKDGSVN